MTGPSNNIVIQSESLDEFWRSVYPQGMTVEQINNELSDLKILMENTMKVFGHVTGGKVSKPNTDASVVMSLSDDVITEIVEENTKELLDLIADVYSIPRHELEDCK